MSHREPRPVIGSRSCCRNGPRCGGPVRRGSGRAECLSQVELQRAPTAPASGARRGARLRSRCPGVGEYPRGGGRPRPTASAVSSGPRSSGWKRSCASCCGRRATTVITGAVRPAAVTGAAQGRGESRAIDVSRRDVGDVRLRVHGLEALDRGRGESADRPTHPFHVGTVLDEVADCDRLGVHSDSGEPARVVEVGGR